MFGLIKKLFIGSLNSIVNASKHIKCLSFNNQKCTIQPVLINLHPNLDPLKDYVTIHLQLI